MIGTRFAKNETGLLTSSPSEINLKQQISWEFHVDERFESSTRMKRTKHIWNYHRKFTDIVL
jgi:hypothetical protein